MTEERRPVPSDDPGATRGPVSRRTFLLTLLGFAGALGLAGLAAPIIRYAYPVVKAQAQPKVKVAQKSQLQPEGEAVEFDYEETPAALILLADGTPKAFYLVCTHFGCIVSWRSEEKDFFCPCHAGVFGPDGAVLAGPPPAPLTELKVVVEGDDLYVEGTV